MTILGFTVTAPIFWLSIAIICAVIESLTLGLTTIWFTGGALAALGVSYLDQGPIVQAIVFIVVSTLLVLVTRPIFVKKLKTGEELTNIDAMIGKEALVTSVIKPFSPGTIRVGGLEWTAVTEDEMSTILEGTRVKIIRIAGVKAVVVPIH